MAEIAGLAIGAFTTVACVPIAVAIFFGAFVGFALAYVKKIPSYRKIDSCAWTTRGRGFR